MTLALLASLLSTPASTPVATPKMIAWMVMVARSQAVTLMRLLALQLALQRARITQTRQNHATLLAKRISVQVALTKLVQLISEIATLLAETTQ